MKCLRLPFGNLSLNGDSLYNTLWFVLYSSHVHAYHFNYLFPRSLGSQSFCYPPSASLVSPSRFFATSFGSLRTFTYGGGSSCVVSALVLWHFYVHMIRLMRGLRQTFTWHPSNLGQKVVLCFQLVAFVFVVCFSSVM